LIAGDDGESAGEADVRWAVEKNGMVAAKEHAA